MVRTASTVGPTQQLRVRLANGADYFIALGGAALLGGLLIGSLNLSTSGKIIPSHGIAGALAGGSLGVELWKRRHRVRQDRRRLRGATLHGYRDWPVGPLLVGSS
jgi:hypothetical protein